MKKNLSMKILCIYNGKAGGGKSLKLLESIKKSFLLYSIQADFFFPQSIKELIDFMQTVNLIKYKGLIVAGGDGSFFNVLNAYFKIKDRVDIPFGILPVGTGNSLSKDIVYDNKNLDAFFKLIKNGKTRLFDVAQVISKKETFYFANMMGFGFITDVSITASKLKLFKKLSYSFGVLFNTIKLNTFDLKMKVDGVEHNMDNVFVIVSNSKYTGGNYLIAPDAEVDDGKLDLIIVNKLRRIDLLNTFPKIFDGSHVKTDFVDYMQAKNISLEANEPKVLSPDGEIYGEFPVEISCIPKAIRVFSN